MSAPPPDVVDDVDRWFLRRHNELAAATDECHTDLRAAIRARLAESDEARAAVMALLGRDEGGDATGEA